MAFQTVFKRYELKYMITKEQKEIILNAISGYMTPDSFGKSTIRNIYFDTEDHILARHSIAKPDFKEKLRIRSYSAAEPDTTVFVELKRKFDHVVYKRRVALPERVAMDWTRGLSREIQDPQSSGQFSAQMVREIDYYLSYYGDLKPAVFLSYDRQAYRMRDRSEGLSSSGGHDQDFRITFDENILYRTSDMSLTSDVYGTPLLDDGMVLMELKCAGGIPLWMAKLLSEEHIYKTSYSKYGNAYIRSVNDRSYFKYVHPAAVDKLSA